MRTWYLLLSIMAVNNVATSNQAKEIIQSVDDVNFQMVIPVENSIEEHLAIESWMTTPFESNTAEQEMVSESWTTDLFENNIAEEEMVIESWMTTPFLKNK